MNAKIFKGFDNEAELRFLEAGKKLSEMIDTDFVAVVNDKEVSKDYEVQEGDKIIVRALPHLAVVAVAVGVAAVGMVVGSVVAAGAEAYKQQKRANELIEDLQKRMNKQRDGVASLPFLRGATNQVAQNRTQPYIIGEHLFTPYLQTEPFYQIGGTDGERQYYVAVLQAGFNKQVIRNIQADDVKLKTFAGESPQEGVFNLDAGLFYDPNAVIEIAQDGADFSTGIFNQKIKSQIIGAELKKSDHPEYIPLVQTLDQCAMSADISISIKGLKTFNTDGTEGNRTVVVIPEYSVNNGSTWTEFYFNQNGSSSNTFTRNTNRELRFVAHLDLNYNTVKDLPYPVQVRLRCTTPKVIEGTAYDGVYFSWIQSRIYNPDKSKAGGAFVADKIIDLPEASMSTLIGVKLKATEVNQDKLKSINILTAGMARTWNGSVWSGSKSTTRNLAAWLLEILTSDTHKASKLLDSEIDLAAFGEFYNYCATNNIYYDRVLVDGVPKELLLQSICSAAFSILYRNIYGETSVAWDSVKDNAIAILNTQNMVNFTVEKNFERRPDGIRINFINKAADYQMDSYLVMDTGKTRDANSVIRDMSLDGKVDFSAIVKDARRMMANDKLRPRIMRATIGMEGTYYKPFTRIKVQHPALSNGLGSATIKDLLIWDTDIIGMELYEPIEYNSSVADGFGVVIQCVDVDYCTPMAKQYTAPENGMVDKIYFSVPVPIAETVQPHIGDVLSYGYLKSGAFDTITSEMMIVGIEPDNKLVNLTLVDYNEAIYATGVIPEYTPNLTYYKDVFPSEPGIPAPSLEDIEGVRRQLVDSLVRYKPDTCRDLIAIAKRDGVEIRWNPPNVQRSDDVASGYILEVNKGGGWITREVNSNIHFWEFDRSTDGYPESVEWDVRVKAVNSYGLESEDWLTGVVNDDGYGTWAVGKPILSQYTVRRAITVEAKQPAISKERYSTIKYKVQIRLQGEAEWYEPDLLSNPDESEDNYKLGEDDFVEVNNYVQQMVPLKNQATAPEATIYEYRFTPFGVETGVEGLSETIAVIAQSSTAMDITAGSLDATKFNVQDLAAITGVFGSIQSDGIAKDANNFWNLAKPSSNLGYGVQGELCVGTTASVEPQTDDNPTGYKDSDSFLHFIPQAVGNIAKGLYIKLHNFIVTAIESLIKGTFKVISKATGAELFVVDEDDMTVSGRVLDKRTIETTDEKALITGLKDEQIKRSVVISGTAYHLTDDGERLIIQNLTTGVETIEDNPEAFQWINNADGNLFGVVDDRVYKWDSDWVEQTIGWADGLPVDSVEISNEINARVTNGIYGDKLIIPYSGYNKVDIIDLIDYEVETIAPFYVQSTERHTSCIYGEKMIIPCSNSQKLDVLDLENYSNTRRWPFSAVRSRNTSKLIGNNLYIPCHESQVLEVLNVNDYTAQDKYILTNGRQRYTCAGKNNYLYIPCNNSTILEIVNLSNYFVQEKTISLVNRERYVCLEHEGYLYIPCNNSTILEIVNLNTYEVEELTLSSTNRTRRTCEIIGSKLYIGVSGNIIEIVDIKTKIVTEKTLPGYPHDKNTSAVYEKKLLLIGYSLNIVAIISTSLFKNTASISQGTKLFSTSDGIIDMVQTSNNTYQQYEAPNVKNSTLAAVIGTDVYFPDFSTGKMTKITSAGVVSTIIIPTVANMKQVITDGTYIYAAGVLNIIIRITTAGVITTVMMTGLANQEYTLGISGAYLFAMPVNSSDYFGVINLSDFTFNRRCEFRNIWSTLRGAGFTYSGDYWLSEGTTQHRINGITQDVISKRSLKEIGSGFVSREVLPDGSVKLVTADGDEFHYSNGLDLRTGLVGAWASDLPEYPDNAAGTQNFNDLSTSLGIWGTLRCTPGTFGADGVTLTITDAYPKIENYTQAIDKTLKVKIKTSRATGIRLTDGAGAMLSCQDIPANTWTIVSLYGAGTINRYQVFFTSLIAGDTAQLKWLYIGDGTYSTTARDISGGGKHGTVYGATPLADGGFSLNGNDTITIPNFVSTAQMSFVVKFTASEDALDNRYFFRHPAFILHYRRTFTTSTQLYIKQGGVFSTSNGTGVISIGETAHVAFTYDGTTLAWYENGVLLGTSSLPGGIDILTGDLIIGTGAIGTMVGQPRIYNRALTAAEIWELSNNPDAYRFDDSIMAVTAVPNSRVIRDANGRAQIENPSVDADIANKGWTRDFVYPVGSYYTQFPDASSNTDSTEFPTTQRPATLFGGTWAEQWATESVYFRTRGALSDSGRLDGKQEDAFQGHGHKLTTVDPGGGGAISGNVVVANMVSAKVRKVFDSNTPTEGVLEPTTYGTHGTPRTAKETRTVNRRIKVWKRTA